MTDAKERDALPPYIDAEDEDVSSSCERQYEGKTAPTPLEFMYFRTGFYNGESFALRRLRAQATPNQWRPVESAPKKGMVDLWIGGMYPRREINCFWQDAHPGDYGHEKWWQNTAKREAGWYRYDSKDNAWKLDKQPTHWMKVEGPNDNQSQ